MEVNYNSFEYSKSKAESVVKYKGFTIIVDNYLKGLSTFNYKGEVVKFFIDLKTSSHNYYEIWENGKCLSNTLDNDDKMWTIKSAIESAKNDIDAYLNNNRQRVSGCSYL
jgi:hypothetical protein